MKFEANKEYMENSSLQYWAFTNLFWRNVFERKQNICRLMGDFNLKKYQNRGLKVEF